MASIALLKVWHSFQLIGKWIAGNWLVLVLGGALVYAFFLARGRAELYDHLLKEFQDQLAQNQKDLDALRQLQNEQIAKQQEIDKKYQDVLDKIQRDYADALINLDRQKQQELHTIIEQNNDDPDAMARQINALFGIPIYTVPPQPPQQH